MIEINFCDDIFCGEIFGALTQWDKGQYLRIGGLNTTDRVKVQFSLQNYEGSAIEVESTIENGFVVAKIPQFILENPDVVGAHYSAYVFICESESDSCCKTSRKVKLVIRTRPKPEDYIYTDDEKITVEQYVEKALEEAKESGDFKGDKGDKGDAGSIKFKVVLELPTEDIDESAIYLLQMEVPVVDENGDDMVDENGEVVVQNVYAECIYVDGKWEYIGSATVEVNLEDYVKKTDYAGKNKVGLVQASGIHGIQIFGNGFVGISGANNSEVDNRSTYAPISAKIIDYAVMSALTESKNHEWTEEEKASALSNLDAVGYRMEGGEPQEPIVFKDVPFDGGYWKYCEVVEGKQFSYDEIQDLVFHFKLNTFGFTEEKTYTYENEGNGISFYSYQESMEEWNGEWNGEFCAVIQTEECGEIVVAFGYDEEYCSLINGTMFQAEDLYGMEDVFYIELTISKKSEQPKKVVESDTFRTSLLPKQDNDLTNKKYVDDLVGSVETILTEIHAHAESLIGGEA